MRLSLIARIVLIGLLACPNASAQAEPEQTVAVPFKFLSHEIVVQAKIDGHGPFAMLLDTGTNPSVIDLGVAKQIGLKLDPVGHSGDGGGTAANLSYETTLPAVGLGGLTATNVAAGAMDLSGLSRRFGRPIQGVLGQSLFTGRIVQFDYPARMARFYDKSPFAGHVRRPDTARFVSFPCRHDDCIQFSGVLIDGKPARANLDTGSSGAFSLTPQAVSKLGLARDASRAKQEHGAGFNGAYSSRTGTVRRIRVGPMTVFSPRVVFWMPGTGHDGLPYDINIGNAFLQDFIVTIDYRAGIVTLERP